MSDITVLNLGVFLLNWLENLKGYMVMIGVIGSIYSALQCFFGYRTFKFWVGLQGFILFGITGILIGYYSFSEEIGLHLFIGLILGILRAQLAMELYKLGVFLQCFWAGSLIGVLISIVSSFEIEQIVLTAIIWGMVTGTIGVLLIKPLIILSTGFGGGMVLGYIVSSANGLDIYTGACVGIILSVLGVLYQSYSDEQPQSVTSTTDGEIENIS